MTNGLTRYSFKFNLFIIKYVKYFYKFQIVSIISTIKINKNRKEYDKINKKDNVGRYIVYRPNLSILDFQ